MRDLPVAAAARAERDAADPGRRVAHPGQRLGDLGGRLETRDHQAVRAQVEDPADPQALRGRDPHDGGGRRPLDGEQLGVELGLRAHAVLEVEQRPVEPGPSDQLGGGQGSEVDEGTDRGLAGEHPAAQVAARRQGLGIQVGHRSMMPDRDQPLRPRASTAQCSTRPSGWTAANVETRSITGQMWFGTTATTDPSAGDAPPPASDTTPW